jgi:aryl-alcohol dehydrogenase-like predicted oxidoreductase
MQQRAFGNTGLQVSVLGLGAGHIGGDASEADVERLLLGALDLGINLIDTAPGYGASEERIGKVLHGRPFVVSTKGGYGVSGVPDWTGEVITRGIEQALARLRVERIDVFHLHSCPTETLMRDDILQALRRARDAGKIRVAAYSGENEALDRAIGLDVLSSVQCSVNVCDQRALLGSIPRAVARGMGVIGKRPAANCPWRFSTRPAGDYAEAYWDRLQRMQLGLNEAEALSTFLRFAAFAPGVSSIIVGTSKLEHLRANAAAIALGPLPDAARLQRAFLAHDQGWHGQV